jgi:hypothetical protein
MVQLLALVITVVIAIIGGCVAGKLCSFLDGPDELFHDTPHFEHCPVPDMQKPVEHSETMELLTMVKMRDLEV